MALATTIGPTKTGDEQTTGEPVHTELSLVDDAESTRIQQIPLSDLPPLRRRDSKYWTEPLIITGLVVGLGAVLVALTTGGAEQIDEGLLRHLTVWLIYGLAGVAALCVLLLLFARHPNEVRRSTSTCYPIPDEVLQILMASPGRPLQSCSNIEGPPDSLTHGSYCVRCLVWRPPKNSAAAGAGTHHCSTCQRCVTGFDHHCGVIGRCITKRNMPIFMTLIACLPAGALTTVVAVLLAMAHTPV